MPLGPVHVGLLQSLYVLENDGGRPIARLCGAGLEDSYHDAKHHHHQLTILASR